jgi:hypothetical protein
MCAPQQCRCPNDEGRATPRIPIGWLGATVAAMMLVGEVVLP